MTITLGDKAPDFDLPADGGGTLSLKELRGKKVVLYFYPKDSTPGCTSEARVFRDLNMDFAELGGVIVGASKDSVKSHDNFKAKQSLPFVLLADTEGVLCDAYGVWVEKKLFGLTSMGIERATFLIDEKGVAREIWRKVRVKGHAEAVLESAKAL